MCHKFIFFNSINSFNLTELLFIFSSVVAHKNYKKKNLQLAQVQSLAQPGGRTPLNHHQSFTDKLVEEALQFPHGASPPPHLNNMHNPSGKHNNNSILHSKIYS